MRQILDSCTSPDGPRSPRLLMTALLLGLASWCWPVTLQAPTLPIVTPPSLTVQATTAFLLRTTTDVPLARRIARAVVVESQRAQMDLALVLGVLLTENTTLRPRAVSAVGALGLFQVMPMHDGSFGCPAGALREVEPNVCHGVRLLRVLGRHAHNNWTKALLAYNGCVRSTNTPHCERYPQIVARRAAVARTVMNGWADTVVAARLRRMNAVTTVSADVVQGPSARRTVPARPVRPRVDGRPDPTFTRVGLPAVTRLWGRRTAGATRMGRAGPATGVGDPRIGRQVVASRGAAWAAREDPAVPRLTPPALRAARTAPGSARWAMAVGGLLLLGLVDRRRIVRAALPG